MRCGDVKTLENDSLASIQLYVLDVKEIKACLSFEEKKSTFVDSCLPSCL